MMNQAGGKMVTADDRETWTKTGSVGQKSMEKDFCEVGDITDYKH